MFDTYGDSGRRYVLYLHIFPVVNKLLQENMHNILKNDIKILLTREYNNSIIVPILGRFHKKIR